MPSSSTKPDSTCCRDFVLATVATSRVRKPRGERLRSALVNGKLVTSTRSTENVRAGNIDSKLRSRRDGGKKIGHREG